MPSWPAIRPAVASLSPVSMTTSTPASCSAATAAAAVGRGASASAITPTARRRRRPARRCGPPAASSSRRAPSEPRSTPSSAISLALPTSTRRPSTVAAAPWPGTLRNPAAGSAGRPGPRRAGRRRRRGGARTPARPPPPAPARSSASMPSTTTSVTSGSPFVSVPVLSITTVSMRAEVSRAVAFLNSMPRRAPRPVPTMIAVGVASPSASGQVMTTTVIANSIAVADDAPDSSHAAKVSPPPTSATSTSQNAARSASRWPGALEFCACCTSATIWASAVSAPTLVARTRSVPVVLTVAPMTSSPGALCTGRLSPVTIDSSTSDSPSSTIPSTGILRRAGPAAGRRRPPRRWAPRPARPSRSTTARGGARSSSVRMASFAPPRARISNQWPSSTKAVSTVAAS